MTNNLPLNYVSSRLNSTPASQRAGATRATHSTRRPQKIAGVPEKKKREREGEREGGREGKVDVGGDDLCAARALCSGTAVGGARRKVAKTNLDFFLVHNVVR